MALVEIDTISKNYQMGEAQVQALKDLGIHSFMLWDPSNKYTRDVSFED